MGVFGMARFLCCCLLGLLSFQVTVVEAARQKPVVRPASATDEFKKGGSTIDINRHWGEVLDVPGGRTTLPVVHSSKFDYARIADLLRRGMNANPVKYAATAAATYLITTLPGASFDPQTGLPLITNDVQVPPSGLYWPGKNNALFGTAQLACRSINPSWNAYFIAGASYYANCSSNSSLSGGFVQILRAEMNCPHGVNTTAGACYSSPQIGIPLPFTDQNYNDLLANVPGIPESAFPDLMRELGNDIPGSFDYPDSETFTGPSSVTGNPVYTTTLDNVTGNTTSSETTPTHNFSYGTNPLTITTTTTNVTNNYQNGVHTGTTTTTESSTPSQVQPLPEVPTDCAFMPTVCAFIDWVKTPFGEDEPDLSDLITDDDYEKSVSFSSSASCPSPYPIETDLGSFSFDWQPACDFASMAKPFVIIAFLIAAIYVSLGFGRSD